MSGFHIFDRISMVVFSIVIVLMIVEKVNAKPYDKIEFKTNFASDLKISSFKENYIDLSVNNVNPILSFRVISWSFHPGLPVIFSLY